MTRAIAEKRKNLYRQLRALHEDDLDRVSHYAAFLQYLEAQEDEEDAREAARISEAVARGEEEVYTAEEVRLYLGMGD